MGLLSWFKSAGSDDNNIENMQPVVFDEGEENFRGLNMKDALQAHANWITRVEAALSGQSKEELAISDVAVDHNCALGKWIYTDAKTMFGHMDAYNDLKRIHSEFHLTTGEVLIDVQDGKEAEARAGLKTVKRKSGEVQIALIRLYSEAQV